jgi:hypothetical protein
MIPRAHAHAVAAECRRMLASDERTTLVRLTLAMLAQSDDEAIRRDAERTLALWPEARQVGEVVEFEFRRRKINPPVQPADGGDVA